MLIFLIVAFIIVGVLDFYTILQERSKKTHIIYFSLLLVGFIIHLLLVIDKVPTSPAIIIEQIVKLII